MTGQKVRVFDALSVEQQRRESGKTYWEFLRSSSMSAGLYVLAAGSVDPQMPHCEDELYYVMKGRGRFRAGSEDWLAAPGSLIFVAAAEEHSFHDIVEELTVPVFFAPAETV